VCDKQVQRIFKLIPIRRYEPRETNMKLLRSLRSDRTVENTSEGLKSEAEEWVMKNQVREVLKIRGGPEAGRLKVLKYAQERTRSCIKPYPSEDLKLQALEKDAEDSRSEVLKTRGSE
jgi:hypothetical protein